MKIKKQILMALITGSLPTAANAAITVVGQNGTVGYTGSYDFSAASGNVLVVAAYRDAGAGAYNNVTFDGNAATGQLVGNRTSLFYYFVNSTEAITIASVTASNNSGLYVWELSGVNLAAAVNTMNSASATLGTITTTNNNMFIVDAIGWSPDLSTATTVTVTPDGDSVLAESFDELEMNLPAGGVLAGGTAQAGATGVYNLGWTITQSDGGQNGLNELAFAFTPIPEPGAALLSCLGLLGLLRRRR